MNTRNSTSVLSGFVLLLLCSCGSKHSATATSEAISEKGFFGRLFSDAPAASYLALKPADYLSYCEDAGNGLKEVKEMGDFVFSAFFQPVNYLAIKELGSGSSISRAAIDSTCLEYGDMTYFTFRIQNTHSQDELLKINLKDANDYYARLEYLSFNAQNDFKLISEKDTLDCAMFHFERVYSLAPQATFVMAFPKADVEKGFKLWYHDKLFKTGIIILNFDQAALAHLPKLDS